MLLVGPRSKSWSESAVRFCILAFSLWVMMLASDTSAAQQSVFYLGDWIGTAQVIKSTNAQIIGTSTPIHIQIFEHGSDLQFLYEITGMTHNVSVVTFPKGNQTADHLVFNDKQKIPTQFRSREVFYTTRANLTVKANQLTGKLSVVRDDIFLPDPQGEFTYRDAMDFEITAKPKTK